jgi:hypothetical protein
MLGKIGRRRAPTRAALKNQWPAAANTAVSTAPKGQENFHVTFVLRRKFFVLADKV